MDKKEIMKQAHRTAKKVTGLYGGSYRVNLAEAMKEIYKFIAFSAERVIKVSVKMKEAMKEEIAKVLYSHGVDSPADWVVLASGIKDMSLGLDLYFEVLKEGLHARVYHDKSRGRLAIRY